MLSGPDRASQATSSSIPAVAMLSYWWLILPLLGFYYWWKKTLRKQRARLRANPSRFQQFVDETERLRRQARWPQRPSDQPDEFRD